MNFNTKSQVQRVMVASVLVAIFAASRSSAEAPGPNPGGAPGAGGQAVDKDIVIRFDGPGMTTMVKQDNYMNVVGEKGNNEKCLSYLVKEVLYADRASDYDLAVTARAEGRYSVAALRYTMTLEAMAGSKWAEEYCNYGIGASLFDGEYFLGYKGKSKTYGPPSGYFRNAIKANPLSRFLLDAATKLPQCLAEEAFDAEGKSVDLAKFEEADAALKDAEKKIKEYRDATIKLHEGFKPLADRASAQLAIAEARVTEKKEQAKKATMNDVKDKWIAASGSKTSAFPDLNGIAVDGKLRTLVAMKEYAAALDEAGKLVKQFDENGDQKMHPLLPGAYMVMGKAYLALAGNEKSLLAANKNYAEARWAFLQVATQFFDNDDYVVTAHYYAGVCYESLKTVEPTDAIEKAIAEWRWVEKNAPAKHKLKAEAIKDIARVGVPATPAVPAPVTPK